MGSPLKKSNGLLDSARNRKRGPARRAIQRAQALRIFNAAASLVISTLGGDRRSFIGVAGPDVCWIVSTPDPAPAEGKGRGRGRATKRIFVVVCLPHHSPPERARLIHLSPGTFLERILAHLVIFPTLGIVFNRESRLVRADRSATFMVWRPKLTGACHTPGISTRVRCPQLVPPTLPK